jgi:hypothetical protein
MTRSQISIAVSFGLAIAVGASSPAVAWSCTQSIAQCQIEGANKESIIEKCRAAGASCMKTGVFIGPITGKKWNNVPRK